MKPVRCVGVADKTGGLAGAIVSGLRLFGPLPAGRDFSTLLMQVADSPVRLRESNPELLVLAASSELPEAASPLSCRRVLVPGEKADAAARVLSSECAVSYGMSPKDSLTFSSTARERLVLAIQRELVTLDGVVLERQELPIRAWAEAELRILLASAGTLLLLGVPPERMMPQPDPRPSKPSPRLS